LNVRYTPSADVCERAGDAAKCQTLHLSDMVAAMGVSTDIPISLSTLPPTARQRHVTFAVIAFLLVTYFATIPSLEVGSVQRTGLLEIILTLVFASNFLTAGLLFSQCAIIRSSALLALANGYFFSSLVMIPYLSTFPGVFAPEPLLGVSTQTSPFLYLWWHLGFIIAIGCYAVLKGVPLNSVRLLPSVSGLATVGLVFVLTWIVARHGDWLPPLLQDDYTMTPLAHRVAGVELAIAIIAGAILWKRRSSVLDYWLLVVLCLVILELSLVTFFLINRNSVGATLGRGYFAVSAIVILAVMLAENTRLYASLTRANQLLQRERNNRLMNLQAMAGSIAHEVRQPLAAIVANGGAALRFLAKTPPDLVEVKTALNRMITDGHRTSEVFQGLRGLFGKSNQERQPTDLNEIIQAALDNLHPDMQINGVEARLNLAQGLPLIDGNRSQLHEAVLNLLQNAVEAMSTATGRERTLKIRTGTSGRDMIALEIADSGPGIDEETLRSIFEAFVTTKTQGMGLGLAICRMIVEDHGGKISASSGAQGATFKLVFPAGTLPQTAAPAIAPTA
jgi:signal transduction histidine kinase